MSEERPKMPLAQIVFGKFMYWTSIVAALICMIGPVIVMLSVDNNVLNPHYLFATIWEGKSAGDVWEKVGGGFPGGHFYLRYSTYGDAITQFGLALGSAAGLFALAGAGTIYLLKKPRAYGWAALSIFVALVVVFALLGLVKIK